MTILDFLVFISIKKHARLHLMRKVVFYLLFITLITGVALWVISIIFNPITLPIREVSVYSDTPNLSPELLKQNITPITQDSNLLNLNLEKLKAAIEKNPSIAYADIERVWPNHLNIQIHSWVPVAYWKPHEFLNVYGEIFISTQKPDAELPIFSGPDDMTVKMLNFYQKTNTAFSSLLLSIKSLDLSFEGSWTIQLNNGIILKLGYDDLLDKIQRFVVVYPKLITSHSILPKVVDLRYKHGIAVTW